MKKKGGKRDQNICGERRRARRAFNKYFSGESRKDIDYISKTADKPPDEEHYPKNVQRERIHFRFKTLVSLNSDTELPTKQALSNVRQVQWRKDMEIN